MNRCKRKWLLFVSLFLIVSLTCTALSQGHLLTIWNAGSDLLFNTSNVSLTGRAAFSFDGEVFKVFDGRYVQDGTSSCMQVALDTPLKSGSTYTGSYSVYADDGLVYSTESYYPGCYESSYTYAEPTILTNTAVRSSLMRFGGLVLDLVEGQISSAISHTAGENGAQYHIRLQNGETPDVINAALMLLMQLAGREYFYIVPDAYVYGPSGDEAFTDDWEALFAAEYEKNFHEPLPEDFYDHLWDETTAAAVMQARYDLVCEMIDLIVQQAEDAYDHGTTVVMNDGTFKHFETYDEYIIAMGHEEIIYEDYDSVFRAYYEKKTGTPLSQAELDAVFASTNEKLFEQYVSMSEEMYDEFLLQLRDGGHSCALVSADGEVTGYNNVNLLYELNALNNMTVTQRVFYTLTDLAVNSADLTVELDKEGRLSAVKGSAEFIITDVLDMNHTLSMDFDCAAFDYGSSHAETFDAEKLNLVSINDYFSGDYYPAAEEDFEDPADEYVLPETLVFNGVEYKLDI